MISCSLDVSLAQGQVIDPLADTATNGVRGYRDIEQEHARLSSQRFPDRGLRKVEAGRRGSFSMHFSAGDACRRRTARPGRCDGRWRTFPVREHAPVDVVTGSPIHI